MKILSFIILFITLAVPLFSRDIIIVVKDIDLDIPLEGAVVHTHDGNRYICDKDGKAFITVPDRQIIVNASYPGYEAGRIVVPASGDEFTIQLRLSGVMQSRELVIEATRPGTSDSRTGRSIAVGEKEISQTAEMGIIEDVMSTIKLLPGVSYVGVFGSQPSIRGGYPGDMSAALDGFYINNPYHWAGAFSIFDPRMVQSAQLSHGVFSTRYGNTISGLLDITSKKPPPTETLFELGASTSAANFNLSVPLSGKGGIMFMGRVTFYDPVVGLAKLILDSSNEIHAIRKAPYIRSGAISGNYRLQDNLELTATGFFGFDGVGVKYENSSQDMFPSETTINLDFDNFQGFITTSLLWNPRNDMLLKFTLGSGYEEMNINGIMTYDIIGHQFSPDFAYGGLLSSGWGYNYYNKMHINQSDVNYNLQGRLDYDWEFSNNFIFSLGVQEMFNNYKSIGDQQMSHDGFFNDIPAGTLKDLIRASITSKYPATVGNANFWNDLRIEIPATYSPNARNNLFSTSAYALTEYTTNDNSFSAELGLRADHFYLAGDGFTASSDITLNPRLNLDFTVLKNKGFLQSLSLSAGTGLFSSINDNLFAAEQKYEVSHIKPNRSWTSIIGVKFEFPESLSLNIEAYYKHIFDRMYIRANTNTIPTEINPHFDGIGRAWGVDVMLQKIHSRYWDGWISYSYNWTKYKDPSGQTEGIGLDGGNRGSDWYFPQYHRFHSLNLILNYRPVQNINFYLRFGISSGVQLSRRVEDSPKSHPVLVYDQDNPSNSYFIEKYYWASAIDKNNRTTPSLPMDIKFSVFGTNKTGKARWEAYIAIENLLALLYTPEGNTSFNPYTGEIDSGSTTARYDLPIPVPSVGFKISY